MRAQPTMAGPGDMGQGGGFQSRKVWNAPQGRAYAEGVKAAEAEPPKAQEVPRMTIQERDQATAAEFTADGSGWRAARDDRSSLCPGPEVSPVLRAALENATPEQQRLAGLWWRPESASARRTRRVPSRAWATRSCNRV
jgi:hypothetical protein